MNLRWGLLVAAALALPTSGVLANDELIKLEKDANQWAMPTGDYANHRYSQLKQITKDNVKNLRPVWTFSTGVLRGHEGAPLVIGNVMYVHTPFPNIVYALDLNKSGQIIWKYEPRQDPSVIPVMCCDTVNRGVAYGDGKIILDQADATVVALDAKTGKEVWKVQNGDPKKGETMTSAPKVGKDSSLATWQGDQWKIGGGATWGWYSYDPGLNLIYYGSGNPSTWNPVQRPGDNKWSMTIFARNPDTGVAKWVYQMTPHDEWDYDGINEMILADIPVKGKETKALVHFDRNGFGYTLDRQTGQLLVAEKYDPKVNWATHVDLKTGRPEVVKQYSTQAGGEDHNSQQICPAALGTKDQ